MEVAHNFPNLEIYQKSILACAGIHKLDTLNYYALLFRNSLLKKLKDSRHYCDANWQAVMTIYEYANFGNINEKQTAGW